MNEEAKAEREFVVMEVGDNVATVVTAQHARDAATMAFQTGDANRLLVLDLNRATRFIRQSVAVKAAQ